MNFRELLQDTLDETGAQLDVSIDRAREIVIEESARLAAASAEPGFNLVLRASRDNVALRLGIQAVDDARQADGRILGIIHSALSILATV